MTECICMNVQNTPTQQRTSISAQSVLEGEDVHSLYDGGKLWRHSLKATQGTTNHQYHIWSNLMYLSVMFSSENEVCNLTLNLYLHWTSRKICLTTANSHENAYIRTNPLPSNAWFFSTNLWISKFSQTIKISTAPISSAYLTNENIPNFLQSWW